MSLKIHIIISTPSTKYVYVYYTKLTTLRTLQYSISCAMGVVECGRTKAGLKPICFPNGNTRAALAIAQNPPPTTPHSKSPRSISQGIKQ